MKNNIRNFATKLNEVSPNCSGDLSLTSSLIRIFLFMSRSKFRRRNVFFLLNKYRKRRATMRFNEIASADDQLALRKKYYAKLRRNRGIMDT